MSITTAWPKRLKGISLPQRRKTSATARVRRFWIAILLLVGAASVAGYAVASWHGFRALRVVVRGNVVEATSQILASAAIAPGQNIWIMNTDAAVSRVEKLPDVLRAHILRSLPNRIIVDVTERTPFARVVTQESSVIVDANLRVLTHEPPAPLPTLIVSEPVLLRAGSFVTDPSLVALRDDEQNLTHAHVQPRFLSFDRYRELVITMPSGVRVLLGDRTNFTQKIGLIKPILAQLAHNGRPIRTLDLRAPTAPVVVYRN